MLFAMGCRSQRQFFVVQFLPGEPQHEKELVKKMRKLKNFKDLKLYDMHF